MANSGTTIEAPNTCEPMACSALTRSPKILPCSSSANSPVTTWSRPCESLNSAYERVLRVAAVLHAEAAADVGRDHAQFRLGDSQHLAGNSRAGAVRVLRRRIERVIVAVGMIVPDRGTRLDRVGGDAGIVELERDDVLGRGHRRVGRVLVAHHQR